MHPSSFGQLYIDVFQIAHVVSAFPQFCSDFCFQGSINTGIARIIKIVQVVKIAEIRIAICLRGVTESTDNNFTYTSGRIREGMQSQRQEIHASRYVRPRKYIVLGEETAFHCRACVTLPVDVTTHSADSVRCLKLRSSSRRVQVCFANTSSCARRTLLCEGTSQIP